MNFVERGQSIMTLHSGYEQTKSSGRELNNADADHATEVRPDCVGERANKRDGEPFIVIIGTRALDRECLSHSLRANYSNAAVSTFANVDELRLAREDRPSISAILLSIGGLTITDLAVAASIERLKSEFPTIPFIILAEREDLGHIIAALDVGARGYIPTNVDIRVAVSAIELAIAGGIFLPASSVLSMRERLASSDHSTRPTTGMFTARQAAVIEALRRGKANKIIAYELGMCESTVKVHIRNVMKKLKATNRTEVAYKMDTLFPCYTRVSM
jgi:DNA-binding NarL/FixJ family response regulator